MTKSNYCWWWVDQAVGDVTHGYREIQKTTQWGLRLCDVLLVLSFYIQCSRNKDLSVFSYYLSQFTYRKTCEFTGLRKHRATESWTLSFSAWQSLMCFFLYKCARMWSINLNKHLFLQYLHRVTGAWIRLGKDRSCGKSSTVKIRQLKQLVKVGESSWLW